MSKLIETTTPKGHRITVAINYSEDCQDYYGYLMFLGDDKVEGGLGLDHTPDERELVIRAMTLLDSGKLTQDTQNKILRYPQLKDKAAR